MNIIRNMIAVIVVILFTITVSLAQSPTAIKKKCTNLSVYSQVSLIANGDINVNPCPGRSTIFTQNVNFGTATITTDGLTGDPNLLFKAGTITFSNLAGTSTFPVSYNSLSGNGAFTAGASASSLLGLNQSTGTSNLWSSVLTDIRGADVNINNLANTATFDLNITPSATVGIFDVGEPLIADFSLDQAAKTARVQSGTENQYRSALHSFNDVNGTAAFAMGLLPGAVGIFTVGDCVSTPTTCFSVNSTSDTFTLGSGTASIFSTVGVNDWRLQRTVTAAGTTGAQTISKPAGTLNVAAGQASIVLTNTTINTSSIPFVVLRTADTTCTFVKSAVPTANTLTITLNAACNAETSVGFIITN